MILSQHVLGTSGLPLTYPTAALGYEQIVGSNTRIPDSLNVAGASSTRLECCRAFRLGNKAVAYIKPIYGNYTLDGSGGAEVNGPNDYTVEASIQFPGAPTPGPIRVQFSGANSATVPAGSSGVKADAVSAASFGLSVFPPGFAGYIKDSTLVSNGQSQPYVSLYSPGSGEGACVSAAAGSQVMTAGPIVVPGGGSSFVGLSPLIGIAGAFTEAAVSLMILGDSIAAYTNDRLSSGLDGAGGGLYVRGAEANRIAWTNCAIGGALAANVSASITKRLYLAALCTHVICNLGTQDINAGTSSATLLGYCQTIWAALHGAGAKHIEHQLILPRTNSSTNWKDTAGQVARTGFGMGGVRDTFNAALAGNVGSNSLDAVINLNAALQDAVATDCWKTNGAAFGFTSDGTHPYRQGLGDGGGLLATLLAAYVGTSIP